MRVLRVNAFVVDEMGTLREPVERQQVLDARADDVDPFQVGRDVGHFVLGKPPPNEDVGFRDRAVETSFIRRDRTLHLTGDARVALRGLAVELPRHVEDSGRLGIALQMNVEFWIQPAASRDLAYAR